MFQNIFVCVVSGPDGQDYWFNNYPYCGGAFQSPIDIKSELLRFSPALRPIEVRNYDLSPNEQLTLGNNGHSCEYKSAETRKYVTETTLNEDRQICCVCLV